MPPGGRGGEILPGVALRGALAAALALHCRVEVAPSLSLGV